MATGMRRGDQSGVAIGCDWIPPVAADDRCADETTETASAIARAMSSVPVAVKVRRSRR
ncbi:MAG TPA: hypothetical protein VH914_04465 [Acidimicrobiia bacterium]|jgi:hypothetical protein|nr:hypothetical protein [Acidimicrobiia bacterium]